jgi:hypothetical protein
LTYGKAARTLNRGASVRGLNGMNEMLVTTSGTNERIIENVLGHIGVPAATVASVPAGGAQDRSVPVGRFDVGRLEGWDTTDPGPEGLFSMSGLMSDAISEMMPKEYDQFQGEAGARLVQQMTAQAAAMKAKLGGNPDGVVPVVAAAVITAEGAVIAATIAAVATVIVAGIGATAVLGAAAIAASAGKEEEQKDDTLTAGAGANFMDVDIDGDGIPDNPYGPLSGGADMFVEAFGFSAEAAKGVKITLTQQGDTLMIQAERA